MTFTYAEPRNLPAGLGLTSTPARPRRSPRAWFERAVTRLQVRYAIWAVRADIHSIPTFVLDDIGIPADEVDRTVRTATLLIIRRAIKARLDRTRKGRRAWTS